MATRFNGGVIGVRNSTTGGAYGSATGRFSSNEVLLGVKDNAWPLWVAPNTDYLFTWGSSASFGEGGHNDIVNRSSPTQVGSQNRWAKVDAGHDRCMAVKTNGTLWTWGMGTGGQMANNTAYNRSSPIQVGALTNWAIPSSGNAPVACIKTDGTLWMWGDNGGYGALGQNNTVNRSSPVQVGSSTNWTAVAAGGSWCLAVDGGKLFAWGKNTSSGTNSGQLGLNDLIPRSSPTQVGSLTNWAQPATNVRSLGFSLCTKTDGTLWSWGFAGADAIYGRTNYGNLGLNDNNPRSSPTQVGSLTNWAIPSAGLGHSICTKTDGTLWTWGRNADGQLGLGDLINRSSPCQVGALTTWAKPTADNKASACIKTDGTLWTWGYNSQGQLGLGNNYPERSSPVQVGSLTGWQAVNGGYDHMVAVLRK